MTVINISALGLIIAALALSSIYSGGMYLWVFYLALGRRTRMTDDQVESYTFHLGLCFIISCGFLGLLLK